MLSKKVFLLLFCATIFISACSSPKKTENPIEQNVSEEIRKKLIDLKTYKSEATVKYISNKSENEYNTLQHCKITGEYRVEVIGPDNVAGNITLFDGTTIGQYNPKIGAKVVVSQKEVKDRSEIFLTSFIKNYAVSNEVSVSVSKLNNAQCTVLEAVIPGEHPYISTEKLWVDNVTKMPVKLIIYDQQGSEMIIIKYKTFEYNVPLEDSLFIVT